MRIWVRHCDVRWRGGAGAVVAVVWACSAAALTAGMAILLNVV